jgi:hypothetical protein
MEARKIVLPSRDFDGVLPDRQEAFRKISGFPQDAGSGRSTVNRL